MLRQGHGATEGEDCSQLEEDDLDELDDLLDDFTPGGKTAGDHGRQDGVTDDSSKPPNENCNAHAADDFSKVLQEQMATLLGNDEQSEEVKAEIDQMMQELGVTSDRIGEQRTDKKTEKPLAESGFQRTVRKTLNRMQSSDENVSTATAGDSDEDFLAQMLKNVEGLGLGDAEGEEGFSKMLLGVMEKLTDKDILYEPMKELSDKFPRWLEENRETTRSEDLRRYETQQRVVTEIVRSFERKEYSDTCTADREYIVDRMQQMQAAGSPPADLIGDTEAAQEALGGLDSGCAQQ